MLAFFIYVCMYVHVYIMYLSVYFVYVHVCACMSLHVDKIKFKMAKYEMSHVHVCPSICLYFGCIMLYALPDILLCSVVGLLS